MSNKTDLKEVTITEWLEHLEFNVIMKHVPMLWGPAGTGKTQSTESYVKSRSWGFVDFMLPIYDNIDISGLPVLESSLVYDNEGNLVLDEDKNQIIIKRSDFAPPLSIPLEGDLVEEEYFIVFLDEIPNAQPMTLNATFKMINEYKIGTNRLHPKVRFIGAGNPVKHSRSAAVLAEPLKNRMKHFTIVSSPEGWVKWAISAKKNPAVISFIDMHPELLNYQSQSKEKQKACIEECAFSTERSMEMVADSIDLCEKLAKPVSFITQEVAATIGSGIALIFEEFYAEMGVVPSAKMICGGEATGTNFNLGQKYYMMNSVLCHLQNLSLKLTEEDMMTLYYKRDEFNEAVTNMIKFFETFLDAEDKATFVMRYFSVAYLNINIDSDINLCSWTSEGSEAREYINTLQLK